jgi:uncharacterized protein HemX
MYLDTGTMIAIMIALVASILTIGYSIYIIKTQNEIIQRMSDATAARRKTRKVDSNENTRRTNENQRSICICHDGYA